MIPALSSALDSFGSEPDIECMGQFFFRGSVDSFRRFLLPGIVSCVLVVSVFAGGTPERGAAGAPAGKEGERQMTITSGAFENQRAIPAEYSCRGQDVSPPLSFGGVPEGAKSLALIADDPDAPMGTWVHWVVYNIPVDRSGFDRAVSKTERLQDGTIQGTGSNGRIGYAGPCPPSGTHRYFFKLYALNTMLNIRPGATKEQLVSAMKDHIVGQAELVGTFSR